MIKRPLMSVVLLLSIVQAMLFTTSCRSEQIEECEAEYEQYCPEAVKNESPAELSRCLRKYQAELTPVCWKEMAGMVKQMESLIKSCRKDFLKTCAWDIEELLTKEDKEKAEEIFACVLTHWDDYNRDCQDYVRKSVPFFGVVEQDLKVAVDKKKRERGKKKVTIGGAEVAIIAREGDVIWYEADVRKKKVIDQYEFCPDIYKEEGLKPLNYINSGTCSYKVSAPWANELMFEIKDQGLMEKISYGGFQEIGGFLEVNFGIAKIVKKYSNYCPENFVVDVINDHFRSEQYVMCDRRGYSCPKSYVQIFPRNGGYSGCRKFTSCQESGEGYVEFGDKTQCALCQAGGWVDQDQSAARTVIDGSSRAVCKVNLKDPDDPAVYQEEVISTYHENGELKEERHYEGCQCFLVKVYNEQGKLIYETRGLHNGKYFIQGDLVGYYGTGEIKRKGKKENGKYSEEFFDREGNSITQSQIYEEEQRLRREEEYKRRMQL